jgi:hypothetical protein
MSLARRNLFQNKVQGEGRTGRVEQPDLLLLLPRLPQ